jgi:hypothetical protein
MTRKSKTETKTAKATPVDAPTRTEKRSMSATLRKHRDKYVHTDGYNGLSINCGDDVATMLRMFEPDRVIAIAEAVLPGVKTGELAARYARLNNGQKRMNAGNRIRAALKRGAITKTAIRNAAKAS